MYSVKPVLQDGVESRSINLAHSGTLINNFSQRTSIDECCLTFDEIDKDDPSLIGDNRFPISTSSFISIIGILFLDIMLLEGSYLIRVKYGCAKALEADMRLSASYAHIWIRRSIVSTEQLVKC